MVYIYDILLNFNKNLIEYFEWDDKDSIKYVKKIALFKVSSKVIDDFIRKMVIFDDSFLNSVPKYEMNGFKDAGSVCLFTDNFLVIGVLIKDKKIVSFSRLLLDEEKEVLETADKIITTDIKYRITGERVLEKSTLTRKELFIKERLIMELDKLFKDKNYDKLLYLYYEYTNKEGKNVESAYNYLKSSLENFNEKHKYLFDILLLSSAN